MCLQQFHVKSGIKDAILTRIKYAKTVSWCVFTWGTQLCTPCDLPRLSHKANGGKQQHKVPQLWRGKSSRGGCWWMAESWVRPLNLPGDLRCCNLLQAEKSSKPQLSLQCGQSTEGAEPRGSHATLQCLQSCSGICCVCPCLCSSRLGWRAQSGSSLYFHSHFHLECLLIPLINCCIPRAENSSSKTWESAIERGKLIIKDHIGAGFLSFCLEQNLNHFFLPPLWLW